MSPSKKRVTCVRKYPTNELFKKWLEELRDEAFANGSKTNYVFAKALRSVQSCPLHLSTADEAKMLDNIGDKIVKVLGDKLKRFIDENGEPTFHNIHLAGIKVDNNSGEETTPKKRVKRNPSTRQYIPGYRTGGYAVLLALLDNHKEQCKNDDENDEEPTLFVGKRELQAAAQRYCDESLTTANRDNPYTAWSSVNTLLRHDLVRMNRAGGSTFQYALTKQGLAMAKRLADGAKESNDESVAGTSSNSVATKPVKTPKKRQPRSPKQRVPKSSTTESSSTVPKLTPDFGDSSTCSAIDVPLSSRINRRLNVDGYGEPDSNYDHNMKPKSSTTESNSKIPTRTVNFGDGDNDPIRSSEDIPRSSHSNRQLDFDGIYSEPFPNYDDINTFQTHISPEHSEQKIVQLGYVYINSDGYDTRFQDEAFVTIDENIGALLFLVRTTFDYFQKIGSDKWQPCTEFPSFIKDMGNDSLFIYLKSEFADNFAPGIFVAREESGPLKQAEEKSDSHFEHGTNDRVSSPSSFRSTSLFDQDTPAVHSTIRTTSNVEISNEVLLSSQLPPVVHLPRVRSFQKQSLDTVILEAGCFEIVLLVDYGEITGGLPMFGEKSRNRKAFLIDGFGDLKMEYIQRRLPVGDYLFVARERRDNIASTQTLSQDKAWQDRELVLGPIIERKRMDDLSASIKDGRFHEQKVRLHNCGVYKVIYLIEDYGKSMGTFAMKESALRSAIIGTQVCNGFDVIRKKNPQESITYLYNLLINLRQRFLHKRLISRQEDSLSVEELIQLDADEIPLPTFREFCDRSIKRHDLTVGDAFTRCLVQFPGMSFERAEAIRKIYPTLSHLLEAYRACNGDQSKEDSLLETLSYGQLSRNLGPKISKELARFFCSNEPFTK